MNHYNGRPNFNSPPAGFGPRNHFQSTPKLNQNNHFHGRSPYPRSPNYNNQPNVHTSPRNSSPYRQVFQKSPKSFTSPTSSPENWNDRSNRSFSSGNSSSSYFGDVSHVSPLTSPRGNSGPFHQQNRNFRGNGGSFHQQNRNFRYQGKKNYQSQDSTDSNPGHSKDMNDYVHPSMLEDPWKHLMAETEKKNE